MAEDHIARILAADAGPLSELWPLADATPDELRARLADLREKHAAALARRARLMTWRHPIRERIVEEARTAARLLVLINQAEVQLRAAEAREGN
jgi:alkanesulfonate monooxygenase SsuD/methylene tetrahydromethanopterin reductase-like flavin-dependent oxidoreductase (luciferase family)